MRTGSILVVVLGLIHVGHSAATRTAAKTTAATKPMKKTLRLSGNMSSVEGSMKWCLDAPRLTVWEEPCPVPRVASHFWYDGSADEKEDQEEVVVESCSAAESCPATAMMNDMRRLESTEVCNLVVHILMVEFKIFDVVMLPHGLCQSALQQGNLEKKDVARLLPSNEEMIALQLPGREIVAMIEHGVHQHHFQNIPEANPRVSGLRYDLKLDRPLGNRVSKPEIMDHGCKWRAVQSNKLYHILVNEQLADGRYDYTMFNQHGKHRMKTGIHIADAFWVYALSVCTIRDPIRKPTKALPSLATIRVPSVLQESNRTVV